MPNLTLHCNLHSVAYTQFFTSGANSFAVFNNELLFANGDGIFKFQKERTLDEAIAAEFTTPNSDFGYVGKKGLRSILLNGLITGQLRIDVYADDVQTNTYTTVVCENAKSVKVALSAISDAGDYFKFRISNVAGGYFSISSIDVVYIPRPQRRL